MGACIDKPRQKKGKASGQNKGPQSTKPQLNRQTVESSKHESVVRAQKYKKMTTNELLMTWRIESTLELSSKMEGPKYLSNNADGSAKVLRVINLNEIDEKRLNIYKQIIGFDVYQTDEGSLIILDEYCSGEDLYELIDKLKQSDKQSSQKLLLNVLKSIISLIGQFHRNKVWLGHLNFSSFRKKSPFTPEMRLVDFNFSQHVSDLQKMGFAHRQSYQSDYQFLGYLLQFMLSDQPPIFIPHKMQYIQYEAIAHSSLIQSLFKGKKCAQEDIAKIAEGQVILNQKIALGYRFRRDINKLIKMRRKRKAHNRKLYGEDTSTLITEIKFNEDAVYRYQTERILERITSYIHRVRSIHEEAFLNYSGNNENLRQLKEVFLLTEGEKKMAELRECLVTLK